jgi:hypothetical protein
VSEEFEDTKARVNQNPYIEGQTTHCQKKKDKKTNNDLQNITHKTKDQTALKTGGELT